jgi:hypothetical protein
MMMPRNLQVFPLAVLIAFSCAIRLDAQSTFQLTALTLPGDAAPLPPQLVRARFPSVGAGGFVAFEADGGVFLQTGGQQIVVAGYGDPAPGGGTFIDMRGAHPTVNSQGQVVFAGTVTPSGKAIFLYTSGAITTVVAVGDPAPGGGAFGFLASPVVNDAGQVAFIGRAMGVWGIFLFSQGGISRLASVGDPAPGGGNLACFVGSSFCFGPSLSLNNNGHLVFAAGVSGGSPGIFLAAGTTPVSRIVTTSDSGAEGALNDAEQVAYVLTQGSVGVYLFAQGQTTTLAHAGDPAPGGGAFMSFDSPALNAAGQVAFVAGLSPGLSGVFLFSDGSLNSVARPGDTSPEGDTFTFVETAAISADGQLAFTGRLSNSFGGVYVFSQGMITRVAGQGDPVARNPTFWWALLPVIDGTGRVVFTGESFPGLGGLFDQDLNSILAAGDPAPDGGVFTSLFIPPAINDAGQILFGGQSSRRSTFDLFVNSGGTTSRAIANGDPAPGGGSFTDFGAYLLAIDNSGLIAFDGTVSAPGRSGLFQISSTGVSSVVQVGDAAPGGGAFEAIGPGSMNVNGQVAFQALLAAPGRSGIFLWSAGTTVAVAQTGDAAPGGGTLAFGPLNFDFAPSVNAAGQVAFGSGLSTGEEGVFLVANGATIAVARPGDAAPGGGIFTNVYTPSLNDSGQIAFAADTASSSGVFLLSSGALAKVASTGDGLPRGTGAFAWAGDPVLNNLGQIAFDGGLSTGGRGAFLAVPR